MKLIVKTSSPQETRAFGERIGHLIQSGDVICLVGTLGAGKTTLTGGIARGWGAQDTVSSPTFTLMNEYHHDSTGEILFHIDAYRLEGDLDALSTGLEDVLAGDSPLIIEWPERIQRFLPADRLWIALQTVSDETREIHLEAAGRRSNEILSRLALDRSS